jgi:hypothetical protein
VRKENVYGYENWTKRKRSGKWEKEKNKLRGDMN